MYNPFLEQDRINISMHLEALKANFEGKIIIWKEIRNLGNSPVKMYISYDNEGYAKIKYCLDTKRYTKGSKLEAGKSYTHMYAKIKQMEYKNTRTGKTYKPYVWVCCEKSEAFNQFKDKLPKLPIIKNQKKDEGDDYFD